MALYKLNEVISGCCALPSRTNRATFRLHTCACIFVADFAFDRVQFGSRDKHLHGITQHGIT